MSLLLPPSTAQLFPPFCFVPVPARDPEYSPALLFDGREHELDPDTDSFSVPTASELLVVAAAMAATIAAAAIDALLSMFPDGVSRAFSRLDLACASTAASRGELRE